MKLKKYVLILYLASTIIACRTLAGIKPTLTQAPTPTTAKVPTKSIPSPTLPPVIEPTKISTDTPVPSATLVAGTATPLARTPTTVNPTETSLFGLPEPSGTPMASYKDIPVMPGAAYGADYQGIYSYGINATAKDIEDYYKKELPKLGWSLFTSGTSDAGSLFMLFQKDNLSCTITTTSSNGGLTLVFIMVG